MNKVSKINGVTGKLERASGDQVTGLAMGYEGGAMVPKGEGGPEHDDDGENGEDETNGNTCLAGDGENGEKAGETPAECDKCHGPKRWEIEESGNQVFFQKRRRLLFEVASLSTESKISFENMIQFGRPNTEQLVREDGEIAATALPFDKEQSKIAFETATFGMG